MCVYVCVSCIFLCTQINTIIKIKKYSVYTAVKYFQENTLKSIPSV